eukprot:7634224-Pyramimonas_sp.AAC.3
MARIRRLAPDEFATLPPNLHPSRGRTSTTRCVSRRPTSCPAACRPRLQRPRCCPRRWWRAPPPPPAPLRSSRLLPPPGWHLRRPEEHIRSFEALGDCADRESTFDHSRHSETAPSADRRPLVAKGVVVGRS